MSQPNVAPEVTALTYRYNELYKIARGTVSTGEAVKVIAITIGAFGVMGTVVLSSQGPSAFVGASIVTLLISLLLGVFAIYCVGVLLTTVGQILRVSIDNAIFTSPFLTNEQRSAMIRLK